MIKRLILLFLFVIYMPSISFAADVITLDEFVKTAVETNPKYQISAKDYMIALYSDKSAHSIEDWNLIASAVYTDSVPSPVSGFSPAYQNMLGYSVGIEKYFAPTGTALKFEHNNTRFKSDYPPFALPGTTSAYSFFTPSPYYTADLSLTITQPLLKNGFGLITKKSLEMSEFSLKLAEIKLEEDWEDFISMLISEYQNWQKCHLNVNIYTDKLNRAKEQLMFIEKQRKYGLSEDLDVVQIKQMVQGYKTMFEQASMECEAQTRKILSILGNPDASAGTLKPEEFRKNGPVMTEKEAMDYLFYNSNIEKTSSLLVSLQNSNLDIKKNEELPDATLMLQADPNSLSHSADKSLSEIGEYDSYMVSITVSKPLFNDLPSSEKKKAEEEYNKALKEKEKILLDSSIGIESLYVNLNHLNRMIELNDENLKLAKERLRLEKGKYDQGRNSVFFVLQAEDSLLAAENNYNETLFAREAVINQIKSFTDRYLMEYKDLLNIEDTKKEE